MGVAVGQPKGRLPKTTRDASRCEVATCDDEHAVMSTMLLFSHAILSFTGFTLDDHGCVTDYSATVDYFPPERRAIMNGASTASDTYFGSAGITVRASSAARARAQLSG